MKPRVLKSDAAHCVCPIALRGNVFPENRGIESEQSNMNKMRKPFEVRRAGAPSNQRHEGGYIVDVPISASPAEARGSGRKPTKDHRQFELRYLKVPWRKRE